jgi:CubicO group peptidase (beta-lactamase class C family)
MLRALRIPPAPGARALTAAAVAALLLAAGPGPGPAQAQAVEAPAVRTLPPRVTAGPAGTETAPAATASGLPVSATGVATLPDAWLLGSGQPWHHQVPARPDAPALAARMPTAEEAALVSRLEALVPRIDARVVVLVDAGRVVDAFGTGGIGWDTRLLSASMAKTLTALAVGQAVCAGKLALDTRADALMPALAGKALGQATLRDLLRMASGTTDPPPGDVLGTTAAESRLHLEGAGNLELLVASPSQSGAQAGAQGPVRPGERFSYKARDPYTVALMLERAVGMPAVRWVDEQLLAALPNQHLAILGTDRAGHFAGANGSVRLSLADWVRLALHVQSRRGGEDCYGRYLRELSSMQIPAPLQPGVNGYFNGYGYFTWTDNRMAPGTFWAVGYGGQRIGWSTDPANRRIFLMFGNAADRHMQHVYPLAQAWIGMGAKDASDRKDRLTP